MLHLWCNKGDPVLMRHMHINVSHCNIRRYLVLHMFDLVNQFAELALIVDQRPLSHYMLILFVRVICVTGAALLLFIPSADQGHQGPDDDPDIMNSCISISVPHNRYLKSIQINRLVTCYVTIFWSKFRMNFQLLGYIHNGVLRKFCNL